MEMNINKIQNQLSKRVKIVSSMKNENKFSINKKQYFMKFLVSQKLMEDDPTKLQSKNRKFYRQ